MELTRAIILGFFPRNGLLPLPRYLIVLDSAHAVIMSICVYFMLKGKNWARIAFYILGAINVIDLLKIHFGFEMMNAIAKLVVFGALLATPRSNRFFAGKNPDSVKLQRSEIPPATRQREGRYDY